MSKQYYNGEEHIFTSKNKSTPIVLKAGRNETLQIVNASLQGDINTYQTTTELGRKQIASTQTITTDPIGTTFSNGIACDFFEEEGTGITRMIFAAFKPVVGSEEANVTVSILKGVNDVFTVQETIDVGPIDFLPDNGYGVCIDKYNGSYVGFNADGDYLIYQRTSETWVLYATLGSVDNVKIYSPYLFAGSQLSTAVVYKNTGITFDVDKTFQDNVSSSGELSVFDINADTCAFYAPDDDYLYISTLVSSNWTDAEAYVSKFVGDLSPITSISIFDNYLAFVTAERLYIYRDYVGVFEFYQTFEVADLLSVKIVNQSIMYVNDSTNIYFYQGGLGWNLYATESDSFLGNVSATENYLVVGRPSANANVGNIYVHLMELINPEETIRTSQIDTSDKIYISGLYPTEIETDLNVTKNLTVTGVIRGDNVLNGCLANGTIPTQSIGNSGYVFVNSIFGNNSSSFFGSVLFNGNGIVTLNEAGIYHVNCKAYFAYNAVGYREIALYVDDVLYDSIQIDPTPASSTLSYTIVPLNGVYSFEAGTTLKLYLRQTSSGNLVLSRCVFNVIKLGV